MSLAVGGAETLEVEVRESPRARRLRAVVGRARSGELEVVVPRRTPDHEVERFLREHSDWIRRTVLDQRRRASLLGLARPSVVWRLGEPLAVLAVSGPGGARLARVNARTVLAVSGSSPKERASAVEEWCREEARLVADVLVAKESPHLGVRPRRVRIADQRTRWGSASTEDTLSFNWRLLMAPLAVFDYVVVHELCHLRHMDHSKAFWRLVASRRPDWKADSAWLDRHGGELRDWSPEWAVAQVNTP